MKLTKYHALGNDYLVLQEYFSKNSVVTLKPETIRWICDRHHGVGADGILVAVLSLHDLLRQKQEVDPGEQDEGDDWGEIGVRIFNPDGSEAEKSGNGLRIFARALFDEGRVGTEPFAIETMGGRVQCQVLEQGRQIRVEMGQVTFGPTYQFDDGLMGSWADEKSNPSSQHLNISSPLLGRVANIGNPHCVIFRPAVSAEETQRLGPIIENDARFPHRTNVQFARVIDRQNLQLEIWERGAGYTLASGSSSCAACAIAVRLGLCDGAATIHVHMPGGILDVEVSLDFHITQTGPVVRVATIIIAPDDAVAPTDHSYKY